MGINKLTALDSEKQEARKNYNAAKAEYEREYCGFPFERLHVRREDFPSLIEFSSRLFSNVWMKCANDWAKMKMFSFKVIVVSLNFVD